MIFSIIHSWDIAVKILLANAEFFSATPFMLISQQQVYLDVMNQDIYFGCFSKIVLLKFQYCITSSVAIDGLLFWCFKKGHLLIKACPSIKARFIGPLLFLHFWPVGKSFG